MKHDVSWLVQAGTWKSLLRVHLLCSTCERGRTANTGIEPQIPADSLGVFSTRHFFLLRLLVGARPAAMTTELRQINIQASNHTCHTIHGVYVVLLKSSWLS